MSGSDEELMVCLQRGEVRAFDLLYERYRGKLYNYILRLIQDPALAADVYQDTFVRVFQRAERYCPRHRVSTWIFTIAHHLCMDCLRARRPQVPIEQVAEVLPALEGDLPVPQPSHLVFYAVAGLNLLALFSGSVILIRKRMEGGGHG